MLRYLAAAFLFRVPTSALGAVPFNVLAVVGFLILGFALPALWLLGLGLEVAYLFSLATNSRFQRLVDAADSAAAAELGERSQRTAVERLPSESRALAGALEAKIGRVLDLYRETRADAFVVENNRSALEKLGSSYVELLGARQTLRSLEDTRAAERRIRGEITALEREIAEPRLSPLARDAKTATLETLRRRLEQLERREGSLREIDSYLAQIEAQVDLALEAAASKGRQEAISAEIDVASFLLDARRLDGALSSEATEPGPSPTRRRERQ